MYISINLYIYIFLFIECVVQIFPTVPSLTSLTVHFINTQYLNSNLFLPGCAREGLGALAEPEVPERQESGDIHGSWARWRDHETSYAKTHVYHCIPMCR